jgi:hypothetical protein
MGDLFTDSHGILAIWSKRFSQSFYLFGVNDFRKTEVHKSKPIGPESIAFGFEMSIEKVRGRKLLGIDHIPTEMFKAWDKTISLEVQKLINTIWNKEELPEEWKESIIIPIYKKDDKVIVVVLEVYQFYQLRTKFYPISCCQDYFNM